MHFIQEKIIFGPQKEAKKYVARQVLNAYMQDSGGILPTDTYTNTN